MSLFCPGRGQAGTGCIDGGTLHEHGLAGVTPFSRFSTLALGGQAVQEGLQSTRVSRERVQSPVSKLTYIEFLMP